MPKLADISKPVTPRNDSPAAEESIIPPWLAVVAEKVKSMRYGVVQIVVHDSKVVQIERTERTRFDVPNGPAGK